MNRWNSWLLSGRKAISRAPRGWWSGVVEASFAALLTILGVLLMVVVLALLLSNTESPYLSVPFVVLQMVLATAMVCLGIYRVCKALWSVGPSAERKQALAAQAVELEIFAEFKRKRDDLPTVPTALFPPVPGLKLPYQLQASRQSLWGMITAGLLCLVFAAVSGLLVVTAIVKYRRFEEIPFTAEQISPERFSADWFAGALAIPIALVAIWALVKFVSKYMVLTRLGPTTIEFSRYPVFPGETVELLMSQAARSRLKFIDVKLKCVEEATFNEGTNTQTIQREVYSQRLFRKRGIETSLDEPFESQFPMTLPTTAMHSFSSSSNRVIWKIEIRSQIQGYREVIRNFEFILQPAGKKLVASHPTSEMQPA